MIVKICGIKRIEAASQAIDAGADLLGMIMVPNRARTIEIAEAKKIAELVRSTREKNDSKFKSIKEILTYIADQEYESIDAYFDAVSELIKENGPFLVGVFRNQPITEVFKLSEQVGNDIIQLHGNENKLEYCKYNSEEFGGKYGIIPRYVIPSEIPTIFVGFDVIFIGGKYLGNGYLMPLLDSEVGGEGKVIDWSLLHDLKYGKYVLAGGLTDSNVHLLEEFKNLIGVDVSGGVETNGEKDPVKVQNFVTNAKLL